MRVASLLPSATELVVMVGGLDCLVGRSHECDFPAGVKDAPILTGAKNPFKSCEQMNEAVTATLKTGDGLYFIEEATLKQQAPDLIVTQSLCNVCSVDLRLVEALADDMRAHGLRVPQIISLNPFTLDEVLQDLLTIGEAMGRRQAAADAVARLRARVDAARSFVASQPPLTRRTVAHLEWFEPLFPGGHWTPQLIELAGGKHPLNPVRKGAAGAGASFALLNEQLVQLDPDWVIIAPCGLDIKETIEQLPPLTASAWWPQLRAVREGRVVLVDGNAMFNRPGPRLVDALEFYVGLLHGRHDLIPADFPWRMLQTQPVSELAEAEAAWLAANPGWHARVQKAPDGYVPPVFDPETGEQLAGPGMGPCGTSACCPAPSSSGSSSAEAAAHQPGAPGPVTPDNPGEQGGEAAAGRQP